METASATTATQVNRIAASISAQLKQLANNPPELSAYLKSHSKLIDSALKPRGVAYEMRNGKGLQRIFSVKLDELNLRDNASQDSAFRNASLISAETNKVQILQPLSGPAPGRQTLSNDSAVSDQNIRPFNETPFQQFFVPIPMDGKSAGVLHVWFDPANAETVNLRQSLLISLSEGITAYLKARRSLDLSQEVTRLNTYSHLLEDLAGDLELDSVAWSLVNFSRETVECERVSIFSVKNYPANGVAHPEFEILACSGLKRPHPRSEHAEVLKAVVRDLAKMTLQADQNMPAALPKAEPKKEESTEAKQLTQLKREDGDGEEASSVEDQEEKKAPPMPTGKRPQFRLIFTYRDPSKTSERPEAINHYFDHIPMNWATTLPLFDREGSLCGILLFEGQDSAEKAQKTFVPMTDLAYSGGRAVGTALYWNGRKSLRLAQGLQRVKQRIHKTPRRKAAFKFGLPVLAVIGLLLMPVDFKVRGNAVLRPTVLESIPAAIPERLENIHVREGQHVMKGDLLAELNTRDQELRMQQALQEKETYYAEADTARSIRDDAGMRIASLKAEQAETNYRLLEREISLSKILAPFDGVVTGPLNINQRKGQVMRVGEPIIEMARVEDWEVKISVREQDMIHLSTTLGDDSMVPVRMKFNADPTTEHNLSVTDPTQLVYGLETGQGSYSFAVVLPMAADVEAADQFRIGYSGNAVFDMGSRPLGYVFFRDFVHFIKLRWF